MRKNRGITLIALVVTIIVLLILAGVSVSMLTGQNGILRRTTEAKEKTENAQKEENTTLSKYEKIIDKYTSNLPSTENTMPYLPSSDFKYKEGNLTSGLVIEDSNGNEYVWIEVPKMIYTNSRYNMNGKPNSSTDYEKIEKCLKAYTSDYSDSSYSDTSSNSTQYQNMLKSVYENGGFWIGRYEAGIEGENPRTSYSSITDEDKAVIKRNMIPYNYVTRDDAQVLASRMNYTNCMSSLMFGIQWDLMLKHIETKDSMMAEKLKSDSTNIGNYYNSSLKLNSGKFTQYGDFTNWYKFNSEEKDFLVKNCEKRSQEVNSNAVILTTGASDITKLMQIYDIAGNVWEWTLESSNVDDSPCVRRGGSYYNKGDSSYASYRNNNHNYDSGSNMGFRITIY